MSTLRYGCRITLYKRSLDGYVCSTSSFNSAVGVVPQSKGRIDFEKAIFVIKPGDTVEVASAKRGEGDELRYGQIVRLLHWETQVPLAVQSHRHAAFIKDNLRVAFAHDYGDIKYLDRWRVMPLYGMRVEGEVVKDDDPVFLQTPDGKLSLNTALELDALCGGSFYEVSAGTATQGFHMELFDGDVEQPPGPQVVHCGDFIMLTHTDDAQMVVADTDRRTCFLAPPQYKLSSYSTDELAPGLTGVGNYDDDEMRRNLKHSAIRSTGLMSNDDVNCHALFIVESVDPSKGGALHIKSDMRYRLKSAVSGLYLTTGANTIHFAKHTEKPRLSIAGVQNEEKELWNADLEAAVDHRFVDISAVAAHEPGTVPTETFFAVGLTDDIEDPGTCFCFRDAFYSNSNFLKSGYNILLEAPATPHGSVWLSAGEVVTAYHDQDDAVDLTASGQSQDLPNELHDKTMLCAKPFKSMKEGFEIRLLASKTCEELNTIRRLLPPLVKYAKNFLNGRSSFFHVTEVRDSVTAFCRLSQGLSQRGIDELLNGYQRSVNYVVDPAWQTRFFAQQVPSIVLAVAFATIKNGIVDIHKLYSRSDVVPLKNDGGDEVSKDPRYAVALEYRQLGELVDLCFGFVTEVVKGRPEDAYSLKDFEGFIAECSPIIPSAARCLISLYRDNPPYVGLPKARERLDFFLDALKTHGRNRYLLKVVERFALCGDTIMPAAQKVIFNFFKDPEVARALLCPITVKDEANTVEEVDVYGLSDERHDLDSEDGDDHKPEREVFKDKVLRGDAIMVGLPNNIFANERTEANMPIEDFINLKGEESDLSAIIISAANSTDMDGFTYFPLEGLLQVEKDWSEIKDNLVPYVSQQINLFAVLAAGYGNTQASGFVFKYVPHAVVSYAVTSNKLPKVLHAAFTNLFTYTISTDKRCLDIKKSMRYLSCVVTGEPGEASAMDYFCVAATEIPPQAQRAKKFVIDMLQKTPISSSADVPLDYIASLKLLRTLLNCGMFKLWEYDVLVEVLVRSLGSDTPDEAWQQNTQASHDCRRHITIILNNIMDILVSQAALRLVDNFVTGSPIAYAGQLTDLSARPLIYKLASQKRGHQPKPVAHDNDDDDIFITDSTPHDAPESDHLKVMADLFRALLKVTTTTNNQRLRERTVFLFFRLTNYLGELYKMASQLQLLSSPEAQKVFQTLIATAEQLDTVCDSPTGDDGEAKATLVVLDHLEKAFASDQACPLPERFSMMCHLNIGSKLIHLLQHLPQPLPEKNRVIVFKVVRLIHKMLADETLRVAFRECAEAVASFATEDAEVLRLLYALFKEKVDESELLPQFVIDAAANALGSPNVSFAACNSLIEFLRSSAEKSHALPLYQETIWRAIVGNESAVRVITLEKEWCGEAGRKKREALLTSSDYYNPRGTLMQHLKICELLYLISNGSETVAPVEVCSVIFGIDDFSTLLEVTGDPSLPIFYRTAYVALCETLLLADQGTFARVLSSCDFPPFLHVCMIDATRYLTMCGSENVFYSFAEDKRWRETKVLHPEASNDEEAKVQAARNDIKVYEHLIFTHICKCAEMICTKFAFATMHLNNQLCSYLITCVNELVDVLCDIAAFYFTSAEQANHCNEPQFALSTEQVRALRDCLTAADHSNLHGSARWRGQKFSELMAIFADLARQQRITTDNTNRKVFQRMKENPMMRVRSISIVEGGQKDAIINKRQTRVGPDDDCSDEPLTTQWNNFLSANLLSSDYLTVGNSSLSAAGIILRCTQLGADFMTTLFCVMPTMDASYVQRALILIKQVVLLQPKNPYDDSGFLPFPDADKTIGGINFTLSLVLRQSYLAGWSGDPQLEAPIPLIALVCQFISSADDTVRSAALDTAITLLDGGHRGMQENFLRYRQRCADEPLFLTLRNHFELFRESLRNYKHALEQGASAVGAMHLLSDMWDCTRELRLLQLLCAGQYRKMQVYLLRQKNSIISINFIESFAELASLAPDVRGEVTAPFFLQLFATVAEMVQGPCEENQNNFIAYNMAFYLTSMFKERPPKTPEGVAMEAVELVNPKLSAKDVEANGQTTLAVREECEHALQLAAVTTLLALIEGREEPEFTAHVLSTVDLVVLGKAMDRSAEKYASVHGPLQRIHSRGIYRGDFKGAFNVLTRYLRDVKKGDYKSGSEEIKDELQVGMSIYIFFRSCYDMEMLEVINSQRRGDGKTKLYTQSVTYFSDRNGVTIRDALRQTKHYMGYRFKIGKVEIIRENSIERVYFRVLDSSEDNLYRSTREHLLRNVQRASDNERIQDFFRRSSEIIAEMNVYNRLRRFGVFYFINFFSVELNLISLGLVITINLLMVIGIRAPTSPYDNGLSSGIYKALRALGIILICVQGLCTLRVIFGPGAVSIAVGWYRHRANQEERIAQMERRDIAAERGDLLQQDQRIEYPPMWKRFCISFIFLCQGRGVLQTAFFLFVGIMGFAQHRIWWAFQLLQISLNVPVLENVFGALTQSGWILLFTFILFIMVLLVFANISYYFFSELFNPTGSKNNGFNCFTLSQCWLVHLDMLRGQGIGDAADWPTFYSKDGFGYWFAFYRIVFYIIVTLIFSQLFFGLIFDALGSFRMKRLQNHVDQVSKCFICGVPRNKFDVLQPGLFEMHMNNGHDMWQYVFFLHYLGEKDPATFTGQEAYVHNLVQLRDVTFYPIGQSSMLAEDSNNGDEEPEAPPPPPAAPKPASAIVQAAVDPLEQDLLEMSDTLRVLVSRWKKMHPNMPVSEISDESDADNADDEEEDGDSGEGKSKGSNAAASQA